MKKLYVMKSNGTYKIGVSESPKKRMFALGLGNCDIKLIYESEPLSNARKVERELHIKFSAFQVGREWFRINDEDKFLSEIRSAVKEKGCHDPVSKKLESGEKLNIDALIKALLEPQQKMLKVLDEDIKMIHGENEILAQRLIDCGWSKEDVDKLIANAVESVGC